MAVFAEFSDADDDAASLLKDWSGCVFVCQRQHKRSVNHFVKQSQRIL